MLRTIERETRRQVAAIVTRLLNHYFLPEKPAEVWQQEIEDWIADLAEFGIATVREACDEYRRRGDSNRPLPGQIRQICLGIISALPTDSESAERGDPDWPHWLEETWGPKPDGPRLRAEAIAKDRASKRRQTDLEMQLEGRELGDRWARECGFTALDAYAAAKGSSRIDACCEVARSFLASSPIKPVRGFKTAADLGVTATEVRPQSRNEELAEEVTHGR